MHLHTKQCCNHEFTAKDIIPPLMNQEQALNQKHDPNLYGGNVKKFAQAVCPECGKNYLLWLKPDKQGSWDVITISNYEVIDVDIEDEVIDDNTTESNINETVKGKKVKL
ncbi:hypothetical protein [Paenibacillus anseongense]|uniref:hypothetical protein n=1 Tax=Paenibacillus anseongense TaxID=2682845 RepID=UPI002DB8BADE|nr:hypothetical protein [Paenibacillus anseongense]MEC0265142.1 hypothetical protein [Paenibacillus anseongense]